MHYLDIIILIIVIASAVEGGFNGFVYAVCSLVGLVAGLFLAMEFCTELGPHLSFIPLPIWLLNAIAFLLILIVVNVIFRIVGKSLRGLLRKIFMGWLDRVAGVAFGLVRGAVMVLLITMILMLTPIGPVLVREAPGTRFMTPAIELVRPFIQVITGTHRPIPDAI